MEIRQLRYFVQIAELKSFSRAATFLGVAQSALSRQIRRLEREVGARLFERHGRGVSLTAAGAMMLERAGPVLEQLERIRADIAAGVAELFGRATLGLPIPITPILGERLLERCRAEHPRASLRIVEGFSSFIHEWLLSGSIDLAILYGGETNELIHSKPLLVEDLYAIGRSTAANRARSHFTPAELERVPLILPARRHIIRDLLDSTGHHLKAHIEADALGLMKNLAEQGNGYTILPLTAVRQEVAIGRLVAIPIKEPSISWTVCLSWSAVRPLSPTAKGIARLIQQAVRELVKEGTWPARMTHPGHALDHAEFGAE